MRLMGNALAPQVVEDGIERAIYGWHHSNRHAGAKAVSIRVVTIRGEAMLATLGVKRAGPARGVVDCGSRECENPTRKGERLAFRC